MSSIRVRAIVRKEFRDYRRNRYTLLTMALIPMIFLVQPLVSILSLPPGGRSAAEPQTRAAVHAWDPGARPIDSRRFFGGH